MNSINPFKQIELEILQAKSRLNQMQKTSQVVEGITDIDKKKKYLKTENNKLRDQLSLMGTNVNKVIEKINKDALKKKKQNNML